MLAGVWLAVAPMAAPALAAPPGADFTAWLSRKTDLPASQIALVGAESVYSLEPLGSPLPTGEVIVLVRTEALADDWGAAHGFQSWDANLLIDCAERRMRVIRSASYPLRNRQGRPTPEAASQDLTAPQANEPAAQLMAAACEPGFDWPLRTRLAAAPEPVKVAQASPEFARKPAPPAPVPEARPSPAPPQASEPQFALQLARGPSEDGARRAVEKARKALGPQASALSGATPVSWIGGERRRYTALLSGFRAEAAAEAACEALRQAKQECLVRSGPLPESQPAAAPADQGARRAVASARIPAAGPAAGAATFFVQIARGPSEDGARKALAKARETLGDLAQGLSDAMPVSEIRGNRRRYSARLEGFRTADAAEEACRMLADAGQSCFARTVTPDA